MLLTVALLAGCTWPPTLPSADGPFKGIRKIGMKLPFRQRVAILPAWANSTPPPPESIIGAEQCDDLDHGGSVHGPACVTGRIGCGETIIGHTVGGVRHFDSDFYEHGFCTPATTNHDGGDERVYELEVPDGDWTAYVWLETPCADLDIAAVLWNDDTCPTARHIIPRCEMSVQTSGMEMVRLATQNAGKWLVVVEGKGEEEGAFALHTMCKPSIR